MDAHVRVAIFPVSPRQPNKRPLHDLSCHFQSSDKKKKKINKKKKTGWTHSPSSSRRLKSTDLFGNWLQENENKIA